MKAKELKKLLEYIDDDVEVAIPNGDMDYNGLKFALAECAEMCTYFPDHDECYKGNGPADCDIEEFENVHGELPKDCKSMNVFYLS